MNTESQRSERQEWTAKIVREIRNAAGTQRETGQDIAVARAHNATLTAERQRREQAEQERDLARTGRSTFYDELLSALAAIEKALKHNPFSEGDINDCQCKSCMILRRVDLSLLHEHDAEVQAKWEKMWRDTQEQFNKMESRCIEAENVRKPPVEDKIRMDWLDEHFCPHFKHIIPKEHISDLSPFKDKTKTVRQAIDDALAKIKQ